MEEIPNNHHLDVYTKQLNNGINYQSTGAGFQPSTVSQVFGLLLEASTSSKLSKTRPTPPSSVSSNNMFDVSFGMLMVSMVPNPCVVLEKWRVVDIYRTLMKFPDSFGFQQGIAISHWFPSPSKIKNMEESHQPMPIYHLNISVKYLLKSSWSTGIATKTPRVFWGYLIFRYFSFFLNPPSQTPSAISFGGPCCFASCEALGSCATSWINSCGEASRHWRFHLPLHPKKTHQNPQKTNKRKKQQHLKKKTGILSYRFFWKTTVSNCLQLKIGE